ncbi:hypothetical protein D9M71_444640 [compost metagenome]
MADPRSTNTVAHCQNDPCRSRAMAGIVVGLEGNDLQGRVTTQVFMLGMQATVAEVYPRPLPRHLLCPDLAYIQPLPPGARSVQVGLPWFEIGRGLGIFRGLVAGHHGSAGQHGCQQPGEAEQKEVRLGHLGQKMQ